MLLVPIAFACDEQVLGRIPHPTEVTAEPTVARGGGPWGDTRIAGARVTYKSAHPLAAWTSVMDRPEDQDDWHPPKFGTRRVERLDADTLFQQVDIKLLWSAVQVRRQVVVAITWLERSSTALRNCWTAADPGPWRDRIAPFVDDSPFLAVGFGGWDLRALPQGGTSVSYSFWVDSGAMPASVQSWAMSRTFPDLMRAFETYVGGGKP